MNKPSILLISLLDNTDNAGLKFIHASLLHRGYDSHILFCPTKDPSQLAAIAKFVPELHVDAVGISLMSRFFNAASELTKAVRISAPGIPIVWGGVHPTIDPDSCKGLPDYVCVGEGEPSLPGFLDNLAGKKLLKPVQGITGSDSLEFSVGEVMTNLDQFPWPQYIPKASWVAQKGLIEKLTPALMRRHNRHNGTYLGIMTSRGCPFSCAYCCNNTFHKIYGKKIRKRSPEHVLGEIEEALTGVESRFSYVDVHDDCFTAHSLEWLETFVTGYKSFGIPLVFRAIPQFVSEEKLNILKEAPTGMVLLGLQSGSQRTLTEIYHRKHPTNALKKCAKLLDDRDIPAAYDVIVDNPYESLSDIKETVELVSELPSTSYVSLFSLTFYKHTALYEKAKQDGYPVDSHLTKNQDAWAKDSTEVVALKTAALLNKKLALEVLSRPAGIRGLKLKILTGLAVRVLEPLRYAKILYFSHGKSNPAFVKLLWVHIRDYAKKFFSFSKFNKVPH
jgi:anaerobic magnesium-protoporphyrin IX monomethyl ester cyclase